ncbi:hypothetical protein [Streptomyces neyagawaensis]|uniref:Uncharacterized protein n=1 Tax=Streptomyces neyagawaensis TaxID=42238 RepID=A0ABV3AT43_9ACTN
MTYVDRTPGEPEAEPVTRAPDKPDTEARSHQWLTPVTGMLAIAAVVVLALTGHNEAALTVGAISGTIVGGTQVTVRRRR